jgi:uncharacterized repeat protein (TIGR01451 family)
MMRFNATRTHRSVLFWLCLLCAIAFAAAHHLRISDARSGAVRSGSSALLAPLTAAKTGALDTTAGGDLSGNNFINPGDRITYTVTVSNGGTAANNVTLSDTLDANTTLVPGSVIISPIAVNDTYQTVGNVDLDVPAAQGLLANDLNPGMMGTLAIIAPPTMTTGGGTLSINATTGAFTYNPPVNYRSATDTFTYTLGNGTGLTDTATVTINVSGMIWFVQAGAAAGGDGRRLSPFNCFVGTNCFDDTTNDIAGDNIFLYTGTYTGGQTLLNNQRLIGQGATASILSITGLPAPSGNNLLPATSGTRPSVGVATNINAITLGSGNLLRGFNISSTAGTGLAGTSFGTLTASEMNVTVNNTAAACGAAINLVTGTPTATFGSVSASSCTNGIVLNGTGGSVTITGDGSMTGGLLDRDGSGGTIQNTTDDGVRLDNATNVTFRQMNFIGCGDTPSGGATDATTNSGEHTLQVNGGSNLILSAILVQNPVGTGLLARNLGGTNRVDNDSRFVTFPDGLTIHGIYVENLNVNMTLFEFKNSRMTNFRSEASAFVFTNSGTSNMTLEVKGSTFDDLDSQALTISGGTAANTTGTLTSIIGGPNTADRNTFRDAFAFNLPGPIPVTAENNVGLLVGNTATHNATLENNLFSNIAEEGQIANTSIIRTQNSGGKLTVNIKNNEIKDINYASGAGGRHVIGHIYEPSVDDPGGFTNITIDGNTANNVTYVGNTREFVFVDYRAASGPNPGARGGNVTIKNNNWNMPTSGAQQAIELRFRQTIASTVNVLVDNNGNGVNVNGVTGATTNTGADFLDIDVEVSNTVNATVTNNKFTNPNGAPGGAISVTTEAAGSMMCVDIRSNNLSAAGNTIKLDETAGTMNVEQASAAAMGTANGGATVNVTGTPTFGAGNCAEPPMMVAPPLGEGDTQFRDAGRIGALLMNLFLPTALAESVPPHNAESGNGSAVPAARSLAGSPRAAARAAFACATPNGCNLGMIPPNEGVTIQFKATVNSGFNGFSVTNTASFIADEPISSNTATATNTVVQAPAISKMFGANYLATGGTTTLTFTLTNPNAPPAISPGTTLTQVTFTDMLPTGLVIATPNGLVNNCSGSVTATQNTNLIQLTNGTIGASPSPNNTCTITVNVTGQTEGAKVNTPGAPDALETNAGVSGPNATLNVINAPSFSKMFAPNQIPLNGTATLSFTITNNSTTFPLTGIGFTDTLPSGVTVPNSGPTSACGGTYTTTAPNLITLSGGSLGTSGPGNTCSFSVTVTGTTAGDKLNSANLTTAELSANSASTGNVQLSVVGPPTVTKSFAVPSIPLNAPGNTTTMSFLLTNPNSNVTLSGVGFQDTLPAGFTATAASTPQCGGTVVFTASSVTFSGGMLGTGGSSTCMVNVTVTAAQAGSWQNTATNVTSTEGGLGSNSAPATLVVVAPPTANKNFSPALISPGGTSTLTINIVNSNAVPTSLTNVNLTDTLPANVTTSVGTVTSMNCGVAATQTMNSVSLANGTITGGATCTITVPVTSSTPNTYTNIIAAGGVTTGNGGANTTPASATLTVAAPPTVMKAFSPALITPGGTSTLTITLSNPNSGLNLTGAMLTDSLPAGLTTVGGTAATTCASGTAMQTANSVSLSGGTIPMGGSCTLTVEVTSATNNVYTNTINPGDLTTTNSGPNTNTASATLTVANPPTVSKAFAPNPITSGGTSTLTITLANPNSNVPLTISGTLTDTLPANVTTTAAAAMTTCSGGTPGKTANSVTLTGGTIPASGSCTLSVDVTSTTAGAHNNTIAAGALVTNGGTNANPATASLVVGSVPQVDKTFTSTALKTGATTTLTIAITNNNGALPFNDVSFTDTLPAGLTTPDLAATPTCGGSLSVTSNVITLTGATINAGANCTTNFTVTGATAGVKNNTVTVNTSNFGTGYTDSATVTVYDVPTISKSFTPPSVPFGGTATLSFTLSNPNSFTGGNLSGLSFNDTLPSGVTVGTSGPTSVCGGTLQTTAPNMVSFSGGTLGTSGPGNMCTINVSVTGAQLGMWPNTVSSLTSTQTGTNTVNATATLTVNQAATMTTISGHTPAITVVGEPYAVTVAVAVSGMGSGTPSGTVTVTDGTGALCTITLPGGTMCNLTSTSPGNKTLIASYSGDTNFSGSSDTETHQVNQAATTTTITADLPDPSVVGEAVPINYSVTINSPGAGSLTGNVTVTASTGEMCTGTVGAGACNLSITTPGMRTLTATYSGNANFSGSSDTEGHQVNQAATTTTITADLPDPSSIGAAVPINYSVMVNLPGAGTPTGNVTVTASTGEMCTSSVAAGSCSLTFNTAGSRTLTAVYAGDSNFTTSTSATVTHLVAHLPALTKTFTPTEIPLNGTSTLGFKLTNNNSFTISNLDFDDTLPAGVTVAGSGPALVCGGTLTTIAPNQIQFRDGSVVASSMCTFSVTVTGTTAGAKNNTTTTITSNEAGTGPAATALLTVVAPPQIGKQFSPTSILVGPAATSTLTFTLTNPSSNTVTLNGVAFTDNLPAGLRVASPNNLSNTCNGTATAVTGTGVISLSNGSIPANMSCLVVANVTATSAGSKSNVSNAVTSTNGGTGNTASATLNVSCPTITVNPTTVPNGGVGVVYTTTNFSATGGAAPYNLTRSGSLPAGLNFTGGASGQLSGTPTEGGAYNFTVTATDNFGCTGSRDYTLVINRPPVLAPIGNKSVPPGQPLTFTALATDPDPSDSLTYSLIGPPAGALINSMTGQFAWTPTMAQIGMHTFTVKVTDNGSPPLSDSETITVKVSNLPPTLTLSVSYLNTNPTNVGLSAQLKDGFTNAPLVGKQISFTIGTQMVTGTTDGNGVAMGQIQVAAPGTYAAKATFAGDANYLMTMTVTSFNVTLGGQSCTFTRTPTSQSFAANGGTGTAQLTTPASNCNWSAASTVPWITLTSGLNGTGNGTVGYTVASNPTTSPRSGTINLAGLSFTVIQGQQFNDVPLTYPFYTEIGKLAARGVTLGCGGGNYCPDANVTREQMSAFIMRALGDFNPPTPAMQRFLDVPPANPFYAFIEQMAVRQITLGCGGGNYCPTSFVTREQMAAFLIRALHPPSYVPPTPAMQRFLDVPPGNPFYAFIDELAVRQITLGCGGDNYCPTGLVMRGAMAAFLVRAFGL